jgi:hypothetical protein
MRPMELPGIEPVTQINHSELRFQYGRVPLVTGEYRELRLMCWCQQHQDRDGRCLLLNPQRIPKLMPEPQRCPSGGSR